MQHLAGLAMSVTQRIGPKGAGEGRLWCYGGLRTGAVFRDLSISSPRCPACLQWDSVGSTSVVGIRRLSLPSFSRTAEQWKHWDQMEPLKSHRNIALECGQSGGLPWKTWEGDLTVKPWTCVCSRCPGQRLQEFCAVNQMRERETPFFIYLVLT